MNKESIKIGDCEIVITEGDITESDCDAIVNAANNHLWMGSGVAGAIKRKGGTEIETEAVKQGPIPPGRAVVTSGGNLKSKYVIHGAVMGQDLQTDGEKIADTTISCLMRVFELGIDSVAFPALGTGVGGFPIDKCAEVMLSEIADFLRENKTPRRVEFVLYGEQAYNAFGKALKNINSD